MTRSALALFGLLALPAAAAAQDRSLLSHDPPPQRLPEHRVAITPYFGVRAPSSAGDLVVLGESGSQFRFESDRGGSVLIGVNADVRLTGPWSLVVGGAYSGAEQDEFTVFFPGESDTEAFQVDGPAMWFAKAGVQVRLPDPIPDNRRFHPSAFVTVAPALVFLDYGDVDGVEGVDGTSTHFAINLGAEAVARFGRSSSWAFTLGFDDFVTFWKNDNLRGRDLLIAQAFADEAVVIDYDSSFSNVIALRFGVSYRFR